MLTYNPNVPFVESLKLVPGVQIRVDGRPNSDARAFAINLQQGPGLNPRSPIILHLAALFEGFTGETGRVVRNHLVGEHWGVEENHGPSMPFARNKPFSVLLLVQDAHYKIAVDGIHFCDFFHRLPYLTCTHLVIDGDVTLNLVEVTQTSAIDTDLPTAPPEPGFVSSGSFYPNCLYNYGDNNNYGPSSVAPPYTLQSVPYPGACASNPSYPRPAHGNVTPYPPAVQPSYPALGGYPAPAGFPVPPPTAEYTPQPSYPSGTGCLPPGPYPGYPTQPGQPSPVNSSGGAALGGLGTAFSSSGIGAAVGAAASKIFGKKHLQNTSGAHSGHSSSGSALGTVLGVGAGALAAGAILKHANPLKKMMKAFDYSSSSDSD
ncbi:galectin-9-like isoform X1 [Varroa destructor]|uniref:Galectin n=1 Tax=Varroa destructor TaxID=109461 RepID=A0A7M7KQD2_VARDE|nr:galectin-9-like isoform X1 [Varroa destructor]